MKYLSWYDIFISPLLKGLRTRILSQIKEGSDVIEIGCGTGQLAKELHDLGIKSYIGIDISKEMIGIAKNKVQFENFSFIAIDFLELNIEKRFDYALFPMIIHSIDNDLGEKLIRKASQFADKIIIADYIVPQPKNYISVIVKTIEWLAGKEHYKNFSFFKKQQGLKHFAKQSSLIIVEETTYEVFSIIKLESPNKAS